MARFKDLLLKETEEIIAEAKKEGCFLEWEEAEFLAKGSIVHEVINSASDYDKSKMH